MGLNQTPRHRRRKEPLESGLSQAVVIVVGVLAAGDIALAFWLLVNGF